MRCCSFRARHARGLQVVVSPRGCPVAELDRPPAGERDQGLAEVAATASGQPPTRTGTTAPSSPAPGTSTSRRPPSAAHPGTPSSRQRPGTPPPRSRGFRGADCPPPHGPRSPRSRRGRGPAPRYPSNAACRSGRSLPGGKAHCGHAPVQPRPGTRRRAPRCGGVRRDPPHPRPDHGRGGGAADGACGLHLRRPAAVHPARRCMSDMHLRGPGADTRPGRHQRSVWHMTFIKCICQTGHVGQRHMPRV